MKLRPSLPQVLDDFASENVRYLELRTTPRALADAMAAVEAAEWALVEEATAEAARVACRSLGGALLHWRSCRGG